jgi:hypothetical protein
MTEFGVGQKLSIKEDCGADSGSQGQQDDDAFTVLAGAESDFGHSGGVRIVHDRNRASDVSGEELTRIRANPGTVDVGGRVGDAMLDDGGKGNSSRTPVVEVGSDLFDHIGDGVGHRRLRSFDSKALAGELAGFHVNRSAFDSGPTNVDSKKRHSNYPPVWLLENRTWWILREISEGG